jgi:hypothetical protein
MTRHNDTDPARGIVRALLYSAALLTVLALVLAGCDAPRSAATALTPMVRATGGASSSLSVTACAVSTTGATALSDMLTTLAAQGLLVSAVDNAQARLILNACPYPPDPAVIAAAAAAAASARAPARRP